MPSQRIVYPLGMACESARRWTVSLNENVPFQCLNLPLTLFGKNAAQTLRMTNFIYDSYRASMDWAEHYGCVQSTVLSEFIHKIKARSHAHFEIRHFELCFSPPCWFRSLILFQFHSSSFKILYSSLILRFFFIMQLCCWTQRKKQPSNGPVIHMDHKLKRLV